MARRNCPVCAHKGRRAINRDLAAGVPVRTICLTYPGITDLAVAGHVAHRAAVTG